MNGIPGFPLNYLVVKTLNLTAIPAKGLNYPLGDSIQITWGLQPMGVLARTLCQTKIPPGRFYPNHPGARGLHPSGALMHTLWQVKSPLGDSI